MCGVLEVSPAGYYAWRERPDSARTTTNAALLADIRQVHQGSGGRYGSPRVHAALRAQGRGASRGRIERLMHRHGIRAIMAPPRRVRTTDSRHGLRPSGPLARPAASQPRSVPPRAMAAEYRCAARPKFSRHFACSGMIGLFLERPRRDVEPATASRRARDGRSSEPDLARRHQSG
ncbi:transposase [Bradyrhizobium sp. 76]|nr:transposase [Bradyrhizobium sp. 76]